MNDKEWQLVPYAPAIVSMATAFQTGDKSKFVAYAREVAGHLGQHGKYLRRVCDDIETGKPPVFIRALAAAPQPPEPGRLSGERNVRILLADMNASNWMRKRDEALDLLLGETTDSRDLQGYQPAETSGPIKPPPRKP